MSEDSNAPSANVNKMNDTCIGPLMLDVQSLELSEDEKLILSSPVVGGLILFSRNYQSPEQLTRLISQVRQCAPNIIIAVDHEGGRVQRFRNGFTRIPPMASLDTLYQKDQPAALKQAYDFGWIIGAELVSYDIDISFSPVLDRDYGISEVIGDRALSSDKDTIIALSSALISGMRKAGMASTGKHFPGHGAVKADSHLEIPKDERSLDEIKKDDALVFEALVSEGLDAMMPAHVIYSRVDDQPAGFSRVWMQDILRKEIGFDGVIFSDDLSMEGASVAGTYPERADAALDAGCDMVLVCNNPDAAILVKCHLEGLVKMGKLPLENNRLRRMRLDASKQLTIEKVRESDIWKAYNS